MKSQIVGGQGKYGRRPRRRHRNGTLQVTGAEMAFGKWRCSVKSAISGGQENPGGDLMWKNGEQATCYRSQRRCWDVDRRLCVMVERTEQATCCHLGRRSRRRHRNGLSQVTGTEMASGEWRCSVKSPISGGPENPGGDLMWWHGEQATCCRSKRRCWDADRRVLVPMERTEQATC